MNEPTALRAEGIVAASRGRWSHSPPPTPSRPLSSGANRAGVTSLIRFRIPSLSRSCASPSARRLGATRSRGVSSSPKARRRRPSRTPCMPMRAPILRSLRTYPCRRNIWESTRRADARSRSNSTLRSGSRWATARPRNGRRLRTSGCSARRMSRLSRQSASSGPMESWTAASKFPECRRRPRRGRDRSGGFGDAQRLRPSLLRYP